MNKIYYAILFLTFCSITTFAGIQETHSNKIINPEYNDSKYYRGFIKITSLEQTNTATILNFKYKDLFNGDTIGTSINILKSTYLEDNDTKKRYQLLKTENIPYSPEFHRFKKPGDSLIFSLHFEPLPTSVNSFDLIESSQGNGFKFSNIKFKALREIPDSIKFKYQNKDIKRLGFAQYLMIDTLENMDKPRTIKGAVIIDENAQAITTILNNQPTLFHILEKTEQSSENGDINVFYNVSFFKNSEKYHTVVSASYHKNNRNIPSSIITMLGQKKGIIFIGFFELDEYDLPQNK